MEEEGLIFRRNRDWLEHYMGTDFGAAKSSSLADDKLADVLISIYDFLDSCIANDNFGSILNSNLVLLLKFILENGSYLDNNVNYKEQIDMFFTMFRNLLRNHLKNLPYSINVLILRLIESRACGWRIKSCIEEYYMKNIDKNLQQTVQANSLQHCFSFEPQENVASFPSSGLRATKSYGDIMTNYKFDDAMFGRHKQLKSTSKTLIKDEVVIKNSDSGKVMGIKGRRIHMIEEMSDTIISFQKVSSTARDRIVQISGPAQENINAAKNLIDATIKQNISPIPFKEITDTTDKKNYPQNEEIHDYAMNTAKYSLQPRASSSLETENLAYNFKFNVQGKETTIAVSDKIIGRQLEKFMQTSANKFLDFFKCNEKTLLTNKDNGIFKAEKQLWGKPPHRVYDRDFLMKFKDLPLDASKIIQDIQMNQTIKHLIR